MDLLPRKKHKLSARSSLSTAHSHTPNNPKKFAAAGLSPDAPIPSQVYHESPRRAISPPPTQQQPSDEESSSEEQEPSDEDPFSAESDEDTFPEDQEQSEVDDEAFGKVQEKHVSGLLVIIDCALMEGNIVMAKRAFGILVRSTVDHRPVNLCFGNLWMLGAKILAREGEEEKEEKEKSKKKKVTFLEEYDWMTEESGRVTERMAKKLKNVKAYYESLIRRYPWNRASGIRSSSLDFYPAMYQYELEDVQMEYKRNVRILARSSRIRVGYEEEIRQHAVLRFKDIAARMDDILNNMPYSQEKALLTIRAKILTYINDSSVPAIERG